MLLGICLLASAAWAADAWDYLDVVMLQDTMSGTDTLLCEFIVPGDSVTVAARGFYVFNSSGADILVGEDSTSLPLRVYRFGDTAGLFLPVPGYRPTDVWRSIYLAGTSATDSSTVTVLFWYQ